MATDKTVSIINPANAVTASRFLTLPAFLHFVASGMYQWAVATVFICGILDKLDGLVAKLFDCKSEFGAVLDALADGFCYGFFIITLASYGWVPWLPVAILTVLGLVNVYFRTVYARRLGRKTNFKSWAMERVVAWAAYLGGFGGAGYQIGMFFWGCTIVLGAVVAWDAKRMAFDPIDADAAVAA